MIVTDKFPVAFAMFCTGGSHSLDCEYGRDADGPTIERKLLYVLLTLHDWRRQACDRACGTGPGVRGVFHPVSYMFLQGEIGRGHAYSTRRRYDVPVPDHSRVRDGAGGDGAFEVGSRCGVLRRGLGVHAGVLTLAIAAALGAQARSRSTEGAYHPSILGLLPPQRAPQPSQAVSRSGSNNSSSSCSGRSSSNRRSTPCSCRATVWLSFFRLHASSHAAPCRAGP